MVRRQTGPSRQTVKNNSGRRARARSWHKVRLCTADKGELGVNLVTVLFL